MSVIVEVDVPGVQGPRGPAGDGADPSTLRGGPLPAAYNVGTTYAIGDYVSQGGLEYKAKEVPVVGAFDPQYWVVTSTQHNCERLDAAELMMDAMWLRLDALEE